MSAHWVHIAASWGLTCAVFAGLAIGAVVRHRHAKTMLKRLDPRGGGGL